MYAQSLAEFAEAETLREARLLEIELHQPSTNALDTIIEDAEFHPPIFVLHFEDSQPRALQLAIEYAQFV